MTLVEDSKNRDLREYTLFQFRIHIMAGKFSEPTTLEHDEVYVENLKHCAKELQQRDMIGLIEPINKYALPGYFLSSYDKGENGGG